MPKKGKRKVVLERADIARVRALDLSNIERALFEWCYTNGARASEPGLARLRDVDLRSGTVQPVHLKGGSDQSPVPMSARLKAALEVWLTAWAGACGGDACLFPALNPIDCYPCRGTGKIANKPRGKPAEMAPCHHCEGCGRRRGMSRHEVSRIVVSILLRAGVPRTHAFAHVLRHSAVTHLLDAGVPPTAIQERVGHKALQTTFGYMRTTKAARDAVAKAFDEE